MRGEGKRPSTHDEGHSKRGDRDSGRHSLGMGRAAVWLRLATTRHVPPLVKQQTPQNTHCCTHKHHALDRSSLTHSLTQVLCSHAACTRKTAQHETPTCARCSCLLFQVFHACRTVRFCARPPCRSVPSDGRSRYDAASLTAAFFFSGEATCSVALLGSRRWRRVLGLHTRGRIAASCRLSEE